VTASLSDRGTNGADSVVVIKAYHRIIRRRLALSTVLAVALAVAFFIDVASGPASLGLSDTLAAILSPSGSPRAVVTIIWDVRLPQALAAVLVGIALALAGAEMQTILNNPLASPFTLGVSSAAAFGAALAIVLGVGIPGIPQNWLVAGNAFLFAFGSMLLLQSLVTIRGLGTDGLVLMGIALFFTFNAMVALLQFVASQQALQQLVFWMLGSLSRADWDKLGFVAVIILCVVPFTLHAAWPLTTLRLGEERARSMGVDVTRLRFASLVRISLLTATAMALVGTVGFVGLAGPHIARLLIGEDHRFFLPVSALSGALIMSVASTVSKLAIPGVLIPIGIVTAAIGLPVFFTLILRRRGRW
jgi:iron complex transport system permease protein